MSETPQRACKATTRAGKPCRSTSVYDNGLCHSHQPEEVRKTHRFGGPQPGAGRPRIPTLSEAIRERVEREADRVIGVPFQALTAERDNGTPDHPVRLKGFEVIRDTAYGKPGQAVELSGPGGSVLQVAQLMVLLDGDARSD